MALLSVISFALAGAAEAALKNGPSEPVPLGTAGVIHIPVQRGNHTHTSLGARTIVDPIDLTNARNAYYIEIGLGTPPQNVYVQIDTGSDELWVDPVCANAGNPTLCQNAGFYDPAKSSTAQDQDYPFSITYGTGDVSGDYWLDAMTIGSASVPDEIFGVASQSTFNSAGIMGLGWGYNVDTSYYTIVDLLPLEGITNSRLFSVGLGTEANQEAAITFGGVDTKKYSGSLGKVPMLIPGSDGTYRYWVALTSVGVTTPGSKSSQTLTAANYYLEVNLDTGATLSLLPTNLFNALLTFFPGAAPASAGSSTYTVPCNYTTMQGSIDFGFGNVKISVPYSQFVWVIDDTTCVFGATTIPGSVGNPILGDSFIRGAYLAYDQDYGNIFMANYVNCGSHVQQVPAGNSAVLSFKGECTPPSQTTSSSTTSSKLTTSSVSSTGTTSVTSTTTSAKSTSTSSLTSTKSTAASTGAKSTSTSSLTTAKSTTTSTSSAKPTTSSATSSSTSLKPTSVTTSSKSSSVPTTASSSVKTTVSSSSTSSSSKVTSTSSTLKATIATSTTFSTKTSSSTISTTGHPIPTQGCTVDACLATMLTSKKTSSASSFCNSLMSTALPSASTNNVPRFLSAPCGSKTSLIASLSSACECFQAGFGAATTTTKK